MIMVQADMKANLEFKRSQMERSQQTADKMEDGVLPSRALRPPPSALRAPPKTTAAS